MSNTYVRFIAFGFLALTLSLLADRAVASVGRTQTFDIGAVNRVLWTGGIGSAQGQNQISVNQMQQAGERYRCGSLSATQAQRGSLNQTATVSGTDPSRARQTATIKGTQDLLGQTSPYAGARGRQDLELKMDTRLFQPSGIGTVTGTQTYNGLQEQSVTSPYGTSSQSQSADVQQSGKITTEIDVDPIVRNKVTIGMHQAQITNGQ